MNKKEAFINLVQEEIFNRADIYGESYEHYNLAEEYFKELVEGKTSEKLTETGKEIMLFLKNRNNETPINSKAIGEELGRSSRAISGSMQKLYKMGLVDKYDTKPVSYALTAAGQDYLID